MTSYCKLVVLKVVPVQCLTTVVAQYVRFSHKFGDIVKVGEAKVNKTNPDDCINRQQWGS